MFFSVNVFKPLFKLREAEAVTYGKTISTNKLNISFLIEGLDENNPNSSNQELLNEIQEEISCWHKWICCIDKKKLAFIFSGILLSILMILVIILFITCHYNILIGNVDLGFCVRKKEMVKNHLRLQNEFSDIN